MTKTTPSDFSPQTSDFIFVKDSCKDSSLDGEPEAIQNKPLPKSEELERIFSRDFC